MKIEVKKGSRGADDLVVVVTFENATNYDMTKHEWVPKLKEVELINLILAKVLGTNVKD